MFPRSGGLSYYKSCAHSPAAEVLDVLAQLSEGSRAKPCKPHLPVWGRQVQNVAIGFCQIRVGHSQQSAARSYYALCSSDLTNQTVALAYRFNQSPRSVSSWPVVSMMTTASGFPVRRHNDLAKTQNRCATGKLNSFLYWSSC